ncbi:SDR family oxidoreductase [Chitinophaga sp.]|uniref:SDR family oxidoreductase n=1 Tax=Chitinophaga sp. TaxID=1869181 RepID=UPI0031E283D4
MYLGCSSICFSFISQAWAASIAALDRVATPDDIGGVGACLCSDDSKWVTGQRIEVSGGALVF